MAYELPKLDYPYDALEPFIDTRTMEIHHSKHHQAYINKLNTAIEGNAELEAKSVDDLVAGLNEVPENIRSAVRNHGGGHSNHAFFWNILKKDTKFEGEIVEAIKKEFSSFDSFKEKFSAAAAGQFGSGWGWLVLNNGKLEVTGTANQDSPLTDGKARLIGIDVWEHAYYLKYQNKRPDYIDAFFNVINWGAVNKLYSAAM
jgi:Fe-Mn family superoxide dismutase